MQQIDFNVIEQKKELVVTARQRGVGPFPVGWELAQLPIGSVVVAVALQGEGKIRQQVVKFGR